MSKNLTVVQINDTHGYLKPHNEIFFSAEGISFSEAGGYARIKTIIEEYKQKGPTIVLDNGDTIHGTYEVVQEKGWNMVPILNEIGIQAMTFHWDIGYGPKNLKNISQALNYPILAINVYEEDTNKLVFDPYRIFEIGGLSIGVIGIACNIVDKTMPDSFSKGIYFTLGKEELPTYIEKLQQQKVDVIIVLSHLGFPQDHQLMSEVEGVDICLSGHTHNRMEKSIQVGETTIIQSGSQGSFVGILEMTIDSSVKVVRYKLLQIDDSIPEDPKIKKLVEAAVSPYTDYLDQMIGQTEVDLFRGLNSESSMDQFLLEAIIHTTNADIAFSNGWRYGAPISKGSITMRDLYQMVPMNPIISLVELTGSEIYQMIEENLENTYAKDPFNQMGGYVKRASGIHTYLKVENPKGTRVMKLFIDDEEVIFDKIYQAAYITKQGVPKKYGQNHRFTEIKTIQAMIQFLKEKGAYQSEFKNTFTNI
ncbi:bifunctional metallophosphatase/5'-nucleotidase [Jeotgalibaca sp. MA1X17-3]|uniref:bifunctional metallophosphatase/5'-nucleotidase n=1 Tax=Jeotgalibaca sp. MA1X17-3 TaxID=2908211 RepID=UPI001F3149F3|nr:bifunctional metallophosphatase/5'-nucleotidase [Jeotgalibaca sp. MA1X17-3]UJF15149.1 bifunctional metallophosphatase/5'-nucleotidase [Jeotgalibaca sp. MA1X17-3]